MATKKATPKQSDGPLITATSEQSRFHVDTITTLSKEASKAYDFEQCGNTKVAATTD